MRTYFPRVWNLDHLGLRQSLFRRLLLNMQSVSCMGFYVKSLETINTLTNISVLTAGASGPKGEGHLGSVRQN